jgi:enamine deaminase RidA (YjgF/YER057c/UK114 family)
VRPLTITERGELMSIEDRMIALGITLPEASNPQDSYTNCVQTGILLFVSEKGPVPGTDPVPCGKLGQEYSLEQGYQFAMLAGLDVLASVKHELGSLDRVSRVIKVEGFINAINSFEQHPKVLDGCSDLFAQVFEERGIHARSVFGATSIARQPPHHH